MVRTFTVVALISILLVSALHQAHAQPRISALVPRASDDVGAHRTHSWTLERDPERIVLVSPSKISLLTRVEGKLREAGEPYVANELTYWSISSLGGSRFLVPDSDGTSWAIFEAKLGSNPHLECLKKLKFSRNFRITNGVAVGGSVILSQPTSPLAVYRRRDEISLVQWNAAAQTIESGGKRWDGDQKWHTFPIPRLTAVCALGDGEALIATQGLDATLTAHLTVFQAFPDTLKPLSVTSENVNDPLVRNGILSARWLASSRDGKLIVGCGGEEATLFECNEKKELTHLGLYCAADDKENHSWATGVDGLIHPRLCAAGETWESIAFIDELASGVSLCRYDTTTKKLVLVQTVDLSKLLSDKPGTAIAITFAGRYLRVATTRFALIELDFGM
jgi:hypothetical protein